MKDEDKMKIFNLCNFCYQLAKNGFPTDEKADEWTSMLDEKINEFHGDELWTEFAKSYIHIMVNFMGDLEKRAGR